MRATRATWTKRTDTNIFAVAKYIRTVANAAPPYWNDSKAMLSEGAWDPGAADPNRSALHGFPQLNALAFHDHSSAWPLDNVKVLGSEYTSKPWDGGIEGGWADFVGAAYLDVKQSGVFVQ